MMQSKTINLACQTKMSHQWSSLLCLRSKKTVVEVAVFGYFAGCNLRGVGHVVRVVGVKCLV